MAGDAAAQRERQTAQTAEERAFELGNIAAARSDADLQSRLLEAQVAQAEQAAGLGGAGTFGQQYIGYDRGEAISARKTDEIRAREVQSAKSGGWGPLNVGARGARTYRDVISGGRGHDLVDQVLDDSNGDPNAVMRELRKRLGNDPMATSLALYDLGFNPQAFLQG